MEANCIVRDCRAEDLPRLIELLKKCGLFWSNGDNEETYRRKLSHDPSSILVLESGGKVIGMAVTTYDPWASFIWHLAIDPSCQGQGLGHLLANEAELRLWARGTTSVNGYVLPNNEHSLSFFQKRGYNRFGLVVPIEKELH